MVGGLIPLAILGLIVYAIVTASRSRTRSVAHPGDTAVSFRRLFEYALLLAALIVASVGVSGLLARVIGGAAARRDTELAASLALASVGVPVFWGFGAVMWRRLAARSEQGSAPWSLYLNVTLIGAVSFAAANALTFANDVIGGDRYDGTALAPTLVASGVWVAHWMAWRGRPPDRAPLGHVYVNAAIGLVLAAVGAAMTIALGIDRAFDSSVVARPSTGDDLARALAMLGVGVVIWSWHWLGNALRARRDNGWHAYMLLVGVFGGIVTAVTGAAFGLYLVLEWVFGDPGSVSAARHFDGLAPAIAAGAVGAALWLYHRTALGFDRDRRRVEVDRVYDHIVAGVALVTIAVSLTILGVALFEAFGVEAATRDEASGANRVLGAITGLIVGVPIWMLGWGRALRAVREQGESEATAPTRRIYLFAVFGVGGAVAFGALIRLLVVVYENLFDEGRSNLGQDVRVPVALLVAVGTIAAYHWWVYRAERVESRPRRDIVLVWPAGTSLPDLSDRADLRVSVLRRTDVDGVVPGDADLIAAIDATVGERLLVVAGPEGAKALPLEPG